VRSLLGASRIQAGRLELQCEPVDVAALVRRVLADVAAYTPGQVIRLRVAEGEPALALADADRVEDVLVNLLANAGKYAPAGTEIDVEVVPVAGEPAAGVDAGVEVRVADQGPGIPEDEQGAVFERFRRGRGVAGGGVGLGLYIARAYVEAMGGTIGVLSRPGHGATFWFRLPAADTAEAAELARQDAGGRAPRDGSAIGTREVEP
jgi:two-component system OmpR family sensor kinase